MVTSFVPRFALCAVAFTLFSGLGPACTGGGGGAFDRGTEDTAARRQVLSVEPAAAIGAVELELPFDSSMVAPSSIGVAVLDRAGAPADTRLEFSVTQIPSVVRVGVMTGQAGGFPGPGVRLEVSYRVYSGEMGGRGFSAAPVIVKALDTDFGNRPDQVRCAWQE